MQQVHSLIPYHYASQHEVRLRTWTKGCYKSVEMDVQPSKCYRAYSRPIRCPSVEKMRYSILPRKAPQGLTVARES